VDIPSAFKKNMKVKISSREVLAGEAVQCLPVKLSYAKSMTRHWLLPSVL
jgi:hypothetical protein